MIRGFTARSHKDYQLVNLERLARLPDGIDITPQVLADAGLIDSADRPIKILGMGEIDGARMVAAHAFSGSARRKIEAAGGTVRQVD
jgi:large subunit ribosomal protein L15